MKHLFIPYELAIIAKENGFDEECLGIYCISKSYYFSLERTNNNNKNLKGIIGWVSAPLCQQMVDWFREKHYIEITVRAGEDGDLKFFFGIVTHLCYGEKKHSRWLYQTERFENHRECLNTAITEAFKLI